VDDDIGDYIPPQGGEAGLAIGGDYETPTGNEIPIDFEYIFYRPPSGESIAVDFISEGYTPPSGSSVSIEFSPGEESQSAEERYLFPPGVNQSAIAQTASVRLEFRVLSARPAEDGGYIGSPYIDNKFLYIKPAGMDASAYGRPGVVNWYKGANPIGFAPDAYFWGTPHVWNLLQLTNPDDYDASIFGDAFFGGGVKYVSASIGSTLSFSLPEIINTTADRVLEPDGAAPPDLGVPSASPRILYAVGVGEFLAGTALVQFPPFPVGWESSKAGAPKIEYWTKEVAVTGHQESQSLGFPLVRDKANKVLPPSVVGSGIFGDVKARNVSEVLQVAGFDGLQSSSYAEARSTRRATEVYGFIATGIDEPEVKNDTPSVTPLGVNPVIITPPAVGYWVRYVRTGGLVGGGYGNPEITKTPSISPTGLQGDMGEATIWRAVRSISHNGSDSMKAGAATVWFAVRAVPIGASIDSEEYGQAAVEHSSRLVIADGMQMSVSGRPGISNSNRYIYPSSIFEEFATSYMVGGLRFIEPPGFNTEKFGERVIPPILSVYPDGFNGEAGWPRVYNLKAVIRPSRFASAGQREDRWGRLRAYNSTQFVAMYFDPDSMLNVPSWPKWTLLENRNKTLGVIGSRADTFGGSLVEHGARVVEPEPIAPPSVSEFYLSGMVGYRIRDLPVPGIESPFMPRWHRAYNDASIVGPSGDAMDVYGVHDLEATRRYYEDVGGFDTHSVGNPMVADRVRTIEFEQRYGISPPAIKAHKVGLLTRYIEMAGNSFGGPGLASLSIRFNKIVTRWHHRDFIGWSSIRNLTPELITRGRSSEEFGDAFARLEWRPVYAQGKNTERFGSAGVSDIDRVVSIDGLSAGRFGTGLEVIKGGQPPYTEQFVSVEENGISIDLPPLYGLGLHGLNQFVLYAEGIDSEDFGFTSVQSNGIIVDYGAKSDSYGEPHVKLRNREITLESIISAGGHGKPIISPMTIWARPTTSQASANHPLGPGFYPVGAITPYAAGERFGECEVSHYTGYINHNGVTHHSIGKPSVHLKTTYIAPPSTEKSWVGWHSVGDGTRELLVISPSGSSEVGKPAIEAAPYYGPRQIEVDGIGGGVGQSLRVELLRRVVSTQGSNTEMMGSGKPGDDPYMWQGLRVGPIMPTIPVGADVSAYGEPWLSRSVRGVEAIGFTSFLSEYDVNNFSERMRVKNAYVYIPDAQQLSPVGFDRAGLGLPNAALAARYIRPDGNSDQYRKGAPW